MGMKTRFTSKEINELPPERFNELTGHRCGKCKTGTLKLVAISPKSKWHINKCDNCGIIMT